jgi:Calcineurin-like phosphoesterase
VASGSTASRIGKRRRTLADLNRLPRSAALSMFRAAFEQTGHDVSKYWPTLAAFSPAAWWIFLREYGKHIVARRYPLPKYSESPTNCVYPLKDSNGASAVKVSITGDWGTGTQEAEDVVEGMMANDPHFTIHLGDVYYIGDEPSINENCLGKVNPKNGFTPVRWRHGKNGSFAMLGNHEMYATGAAFVCKFLPTLGMCKAGENWRIIAIPKVKPRAFFVWRRRVLSSTLRP